MVLEYNGWNFCEKTKHIRTQLKLINVVHLRIKGYVQNHKRKQIKLALIVAILKNIALRQMKLAL